MKYLKQYKDPSIKEAEVSEEVARQSLDGAYDPNEVENILVTPGVYNCGLSYITVKDE